MKEKIKVQMGIQERGKKQQSHFSPKWSALEKKEKGKNILCLHSIMAVQAVITARIVWVPHNIQRLVVC